MSRASDRTQARRRAHGPQQAARKADALAESRAIAKQQRKGAKGVEAQMARRGYRSVLSTRRIRLTGGRLESVTVHSWRRVPQEVAA